MPCHTKLTNAGHGDKFVKVRVPAPSSSNRNLKLLQSSFMRHCYVLQAGTPKTPLVCVARRLSSVKDSLGSAEPCLLCYNPISCPIISSNLMLMIKNYARQLK